MTEQELQDIERRNIESCTTNTGEVLECWAGRDTDYVEVTAADVRALIAEVRRLRVVLNTSDFLREQNAPNPARQYQQFRKLP